MKKTLILLIAAAVLFVGLGTLAFAATPQDIWEDFNDNGVLDGTYTDAELRAYLNDATLHQYPPDSTKIKTLDTIVRGILTARDRFPFTGTEIALLAVGALVLLAGGLGLRRLARSRA